jgi:ornithine cyclodeaminase/alanine dehydrogenase-like protein (mu-crystallin family)
VLALFDGTDGRLLALMASGSLTAIRTAAATAIAARCLARPESAVATVVGCGAQAPWQLRALAAVLPLRTVHAVDIDPQRAEAFARKMSTELGCDVIVAQSIREALATSDVCVTCTTARTPVVLDADVRPGTFVAAVGADNEHKQEIEPALLCRATVVPDQLTQAAAGGDLHWAIESGLLRLDEVHAELADVVSGRRPGRQTADEITLFDSTGVALEDVAAAAVVYKNAGLAVR